MTDPNISEPGLVSPLQMSLLREKKILWYSKGLKPAKPANNQTIIDCTQCSHTINIHQLTPPPPPKKKKRMYVQTI